MIYYAHKTDNDFYLDIYQNIRAVQMSGKGKKIYILSIEEDSQGKYVGWKDKEGKIGLIFPHIFLLRVCFPYGIDAEIKAGKGYPVNLKITETRE